MNKSLATLTAESLRLRILQALLNASGYTIDLDTLSDYLTVSMLQLTENAAWLEENGLVGLDRVDGVTFVQMGRMGMDVALGRLQVPGVRRPDPAASLMSLNTQLIKRAMGQP